mmetsp:Transcript_4846/g.11682  ORF Transcript_4846/g.11682 Transcript_4846/m.11682 type:complete len:223 (-) Transcript_4846:1429-2097(-)
MPRRQRFSNMHGQGFCASSLLRDSCLPSLPGAAHHRRLGLLQPARPAPHCTVADEDGHVACAAPHRVLHPFLLLPRLRLGRARRLHLLPPRTDRDLHRVDLRVERGLDHAGRSRQHRGSVAHDHPRGLSCVLRALHRHDRRHVPLVRQEHRRPCRGGRLRGLHVLHLIQPDPLPLPYRLLLPRHRVDAGHWHHALLPRRRLHVLQGAHGAVRADEMQRPQRR